MRNFSQFSRKGFAVSMLVLVLACSASAGDIPFPGVTAAPPATTSGEMQYPGATVDPLTEIALSLLQSALSLF